MPLDNSEMTLEEVLRTYSSVKGHRTCCEREIKNLLALLKVKYSSTSETRINDRSKLLEKHNHKLSDITDFLLTVKYTKAQDHQEEVAEFLQVLDECSNENIHRASQPKHSRSSRSSRCQSPSVCSSSGTI